MTALRTFCTRRQGRRDSTGASGPADELDNALFEKLKAWLVRDPMGC